MFCSDVQTCHHVRGGGVCVYFLKSVRKGRFRNVWVWRGGGGAHISQYRATHWAGHTDMHYTSPSGLFRIIIVIHVAFFRQGWDPVGTNIAQTSMSMHVAKCLGWGGGTFDPKTGRQKQWPQRSSDCCAPCGCMQVAVSGRYGASLPGYQAHTVAPAPTVPPRASPLAHQRLLWCIRGSNSPWSEFRCGHGSCVLTKRGSKQHMNRPKWTKISKMVSLQHADPGCSK